MSIENEYRKRNKGDGKRESDGKNPNVGTKRQRRSEERNEI